MIRPKGILFLVLLLTGTLVACGGATSPSANPEPQGSPVASPAQTTQRSEGGQVTAEATWNGPTAGATFEVKLDTHSFDLDVLDLSDAVLRNDRGETLTASPWAAPPGGHHREGGLTFNGDASSFFAGAKWIELALTGVGDLPERTLRWQIGA